LDTHTDTEFASIPVVRALMVSPWVDYAQSQGAAAETLLIRSGIRPEILQHGTAAVPLRKVLRWTELACGSLGTQHLGLYVGRATSNQDLGHYGLALERALTLYEYIQQGIALYGTVVAGLCFWLSRHGDLVRLNIDSAAEPDLGVYQAYLSSFAVTIANIRRFAGPHWRPTELCFGFQTRERPPLNDLFEEVPVRYRPGRTYLSFPYQLLGLRRGGVPRSRAAEAPTSRMPLPSDLAGLVEIQIESMLCSQGIPIDLVAETLGISRRSLQRGLAAQGASFKDLLAAARVRQAARWLRGTDKPVLEIAFDLGYSDASNFTRAFRRQTGVSPITFRRGVPRQMAIGAE